MVVSFLARIFRFLLSLRYTVHTHGIEVLSTNQPILLLPNHQAYVDPQILLAHVLPHKHISPVMTEIYYHDKFLGPIFKFLHAVPVPHLQKATQDADFGALFSKISDHITSGNSILLYPSGQITGQGYEAILGKQTAYHIAKLLPANARIILVREQGLWGSMWSRAWMGKAPNLFATMGKAIWYIIANGIFFCPRRKVHLTFEDVTDDAKQMAQKDVDSFNTFLEDFYNKEGEEQVTYLKHYFYAPALQKTLPDKIELSIKEFQDANVIEQDAIDPDVFTYVSEQVAALKEIDKNTIVIENNLILDLHFDSLNQAEIVMILRTEFPSSSNPPLSSLKTVGDLCLMAQGDLTEIQELPACAFGEDGFSDDPVSIKLNKNIVQNFLSTFSTSGEKQFCYDAYFGSITRKDFLLKSIVLSLLIRKLVPEKNVGLMLPALQSTSMLIIATQLARKTPVMLNWTVGEAAMQHCMDTVNIKKIITVRNFFDGVKDQIPKVFHSRFIFLEDETKKMSLSMKLQGFIASKMPKLWFSWRKYPDNAVVLFTSGSESLPKPVPLTHKNIVVDLHGVLQVFPVRHSEKILSFLPPFHSFGFSVTTILPLMTGARILYTPNPSDTASILKVIRHTNPTMMASTPTFLKMLMAAAKEGDLTSLRTVASGAEACGEDVRRGLAEKTGGKAVIAEGYGITECGPVVTINPPSAPKSKSVGVFLSCIDHCIVSIDTGKKVGPGEEGMIYIKGDSIFGGYLDQNIASPFEEIEGDLYYKTGDLGFLDTEGYLHITGRLKRFIKIAGEMVSLPAIESKLLEGFGGTEEIVLAVEGSDKVEKPVIVLFTINGLTKEQANIYLREQGMSNLLSIHEVRAIEEIPVLGTGKIDYKVLKKMIEE